MLGAGCFGGAPPATDALLRLGHGWRRRRRRFWGAYSRIDYTVAGRRIPEDFRCGPT
jgi:hypothetical protein